MLKQPVPHSCEIKYHIIKQNKYVIAYKIYIIYIIIKYNITYINKYL